MGSFISWIKTNLGNAQNNDSRPGSAQKKGPQSAWGMLMTLAPVAAASLVYLGIFLLMRSSNRRFYAPRTYLGSLKEAQRSPRLPDGRFNWISIFWKIPDVYILKHQSLDAYLFLRFLRITAIIAFGTLCITWPVLFPVNATGGNGNSQLEVLSYSNISIDRKNRFYAHTFIGWLVYAFVMYMIMRECIFYINLRQAYLLGPHYANRISARTVLFTSVPECYLDERKICQVFANTVKYVWIAGDTTDLDRLVKDRDETAFKLEKAEIKLLATVNKARAKYIKKNGISPPKAGEGNPETGNVASRWISDEQRPSHRLGPLGLFGRKVDTIEWGRSQLQRLIPMTEAAQKSFVSGQYTKNCAVFVEFHTQTDAQAAFQGVTHHHALQMFPKYVGIKPNDVIWESLNKPWWQKVVQRYFVYAIIAVMIIFWAIPVGVVGIISQISTLTKLPGLTWLDDLPDQLLGLISSLLPPVALSILMALVPVFIRALAKIAGEPSASRVELFTQNAYFCFQVVQVFLVQTLANAASTALVQIITSPGNVFSILSSSLPTASNFYISYFIVQGFTVATGVLTRVVGLFISQLLYKFLAKTPRAMYAKWTSLVAISWGSVLPVYTNIAVISITYSIIAPIMLFWSSLSLGLFYLAYRYNILFVTETEVDTCGLIYPRALKQLTVGVYLSQICMVGLFITSKAAGPAVLTGMALIATVLFHITLQRALNPLLYGLPRTLSAEERTYQSREAGHCSGVELEQGQMSNETGTENSDKQPTVLQKLAPSQSEGGVQKKGNLFIKFLKPWALADCEAIRKLVPQETDVNLSQGYDEEVESKSYWPPSAVSLPPVLWIPKDTLGVSEEEIAITSKMISITDESATMDENGKVDWDAETARPPIWQEKIEY